MHLQPRFFFFRLTPKTSERAACFYFAFTLKASERWAFFYFAFTLKASERWAFFLFSLHLKNIGAVGFSPPPSYREAFSFASAATTLSRSSCLRFNRRSAIASSLSARISAARIAALVAPAEPRATVATGMPDGI